MAQTVKASDEMLMLDKERSAFIRRFGLQNIEGVTLARAENGQPCIFGSKDALLKLATALGEVPIASTEYQQMSSLIKWIRKYLGVKT